jgi:hypothetical protein
MQSIFEVRANVGDDAIGIATGFANVHQKNMSIRQASIDRKGCEGAALRIGRVTE